MKALQVVESAYRCTLEEQDDPVVWIAQAMKGAGADLDLLLRGNAVNYAVVGQDASGLAFGSKKQTQPPRLEQDLLRAMEKGLSVYVLTEDAQERGISEDKIVNGIKKVSRSELPTLFDKYEQIWHW